MAFVPEVQTVLGVFVPEALKVPAVFVPEAQTVPAVFVPEVQEVLVAFAPEVQEKIPGKIADILPDVVHPFCYTDYNSNYFTSFCIDVHIISYEHYVKR